MDITNINLGTCPPQYLPIGYRDEYGARPVAFDFSAWAAEYGAGVLQLLLQRPGEKEPFPVLLDIDGTTATWTPDEVATKNEGQGRAQLLYTREGLQVRDAVFTVLIAPSLGAAGDPPEPYEDWLERLLTIAAEAQQSAIDAAGSAEAAGTSAGAAAGSAGAAAQSAADAEAAKTDADAAARVAGQSAALAGEKATQAAQSAQTAAQKATAAQQSAEDAQRAASAAAASAAVAQELIDQIPDIEAKIDTKAPAIYESIGPAAIASFADGADNMPLKSLVVDIPATQSGTGDPSPENVRPFVGRTDVSVTRTGKNLFDKTKYEYARYLNQASGTTSVSIGTPKWDVSDYIRVKGDTVYTSSPWGISTRSEWCYYDSNRRFISGVSSAARRQRTPPNAVYLRVDFPHPSLNSFQLEEGSSATPTQAYEGEVVDIDWADVAGTVYAGTLTINQDGSGTLSALPHYASYAGETLVGPWVSSMDVYAEGATPTTGAEVVDLGGSATVCQLTAEQIRTLKGGNNIWSDAGDVTAVYPADTKTYVDAQTAALAGEIDTLGGEVDTLQDDVDALEGNVADTQSMLATVETSETASKSYAIGDLLVFGGTLYKVTAAIPAGATITPGSNVTQTTVEEQIAASGGGGGSGGETWYTAELSAANYDSTLKMLLFDAGANNELKDVVAVGQIVNNGEQTANEIISFGIGNTADRPGYSCFAFADAIPATMRRISFAIQFSIVEFVRGFTLRTAMPQSFYYIDNNKDANELNYDSPLSKYGRTQAPVAYRQFNDPRYFKIELPTWIPQWAYIKLYYTLQ